MTDEESQQLRALRDLVYGIRSSDSNWAGCSDHWMQPEEVRWLQQQAAKLEKP